MGAATITRDAVRNVQISLTLPGMHGMNIGVIYLLSMSVQYTVDFEPLRLSSKGQRSAKTFVFMVTCNESKGQSLQRIWYV